MFIRFVNKNFGVDNFSKREVFIEGWVYGDTHAGLFDSFTSALAHSMGLWEEYCEYHRTQRPVKPSPGSRVKRGHNVHS